MWGRRGVLCSVMPIKDVIIRRPTKIREELKRKEALDNCGRAVPGWLLEIFVGRYHLELWASELDGHLMHLGKLAKEKYGRDLDPQMDRIRKLMAQIRGIVHLTMPYSQCNCDVHETDCPRCKGSRWYTKQDLIESGNALRG